MVGESCALQLCVDLFDLDAELFVAIIEESALIVFDVLSFLANFVEGFKSSHLLLVSYHVCL